MRAERYELRPGRVLFKRSDMIYGHFIEHFHRQIYGGVYDPGSPFADETGLRTDVLEAMRKIRVPVLRWPGGCFVSAYNWKRLWAPTVRPCSTRRGGSKTPTASGLTSISPCAARWAVRLISVPMPGRGPPKK